MSLPIALGCIIAALVVGCILGGLYRKKVSEREIGSAEEKAKQIINDAYKSAESKRRETLLEAKEEIIRLKNELDKEMEERGLDFVRYADDCIIMVGSEQAANRVMKSISGFIEEKLGLKVNATKSRVGKPKHLKYLGYGFYYDTFAKQYKARPHAKAVAKFKARMRQLTCRSWGVSNSVKVQKLNQLIRGWINYFKIGSMKSLCAELDNNIRYRLRMCIWKHWKTPKNRAKNLIKLGIPAWSAWKTVYISGYAKICRSWDVHQTISNARLEEFGLISMKDYYVKRITC